MKPFLAAAALLAATTVGAATPAEYSTLRAARPGKRSIPAANITLTRDAFQFTFTSGAFHFLDAVGGREAGAVFTGSGRYTLTPASEAERRHLGLVTNKEDLVALTDEFDRAVFLYSDATFQELTSRGGVQAGSISAEATKTFDEYLNFQTRDLQLNVHARLVADILDGVPPAGGVFVASFEGKKHGRMMAIVDPQGIGNFAAKFSMFGGEETALISTDQHNGGFWYLAGSGKSDPAGRGKPLVRSTDATAYTIDTTIKGRELSGTTTISFTPNRPLRVLPIHIHPKLRITKATLKGGGELSVIQEETETSKWRKLFQDEAADSDAAIVLPTPLERGAATEVELTYEGTGILERIYNDSFSVRARESWYPNLGTFTDLARYDLTFRYPKRDELISVGKLIEQKVEENMNVARWQPQSEIRVAGFNYGKFEELKKKDDATKTDITVFTHRDRKQYAESALADAMNTLRVGNAFFGPSPYPSVSVTQQAEWSFGQSWPSLIFLPGVALTSSTERAEALEGESLRSVSDFATNVGPHEIAHQWWGHLIGWQSYRDQWLSEGFSEFTAALVVEQTENLKKYDAFWEQRRKEILGGVGLRNYKAGPMSQGYRLATRRNYAAPQAMIYAKAGYLLHMLRMMMRDTSAATPDAKFITMLRDYVASYSGKSPSAADFQKVVERHMLPAMDLGGDGTMKWFFDQWVFGTDIPRYKHDLKAGDIGGGRYRISGTLSQSEVSPEFRASVPVYVDFGNNQVARIGTVPLKGVASMPLNVELKLPKKPKKITINAMHDILSLD